MGFIVVAAGARSHLDQRDYLRIVYHDGNRAAFQSCGGIPVSVEMLAVQCEEDRTRFDPAAVGRNVRVQQK